MEEADEIFSLENPSIDRAKQATIMIWIGILLDGIPESVVIGMLTVTGKTTSTIAFVIGVFLSNFAEAISSSGAMIQHGMRSTVVFAMWFSIVIVTMVSAAVGAGAFSNSNTSNVVMAGVEGLAGGAMLSMIASTILPEAFEKGSALTGLAALAGFLVAYSVKAI